MNLFEIQGKISLDSSGALGAINSVTGAAKSAASAIGSLAGTALKIGGTVAAGVATAGGAIVKSAVTSYAEAEQLIGGINTLFGDSASTVQAYAANAYQTAGLSSNQYMETVMGFSASLRQSLNGDTDAMAEYANMAVTDMADNANKMGTDMGMIQNAYQGFAKQNYTMLDNLKLGYGGTKGEMQRLIADANDLKEAMGETGDLSIDSLADVVEAIHIVQTEMGITGTTALEAEKTITGSTASMKAAWSNLMTGVADENADMDKLVDNFVDAGVTAAENVVPRVATAIRGTMQLGQTLVPAILDQFELAMPELEEGVSVLLSEGLSFAGINVSPQEIRTTISTLFEEVGKTKDWIANGPIGDLGKTIGETITGIGDILGDNGIDISSIFEGLRDGVGLVAEPLAAVTGAVGEFGKAMVEWFSTDGTIANALLLTAGGALGDVSGGLTTTFEVIGGGIKSWNELMRGDTETAAKTWDNTVSNWADDVNSMNANKFSVDNLDILPAQQTMEELDAQLAAERGMKPIDTSGFVGAFDSDFSDVEGKFAALDAQLAAERGLGSVDTGEFTSSIDGVQNALSSLDGTSASTTVEAQGAETAAAEIEAAASATEAADGTTATMEVEANGAEAAASAIGAVTSAAEAAGSTNVNVTVDASSTTQAQAQVQQSAQAMQSAMEFSLSVPPVDTSSFNAAVSAASSAASAIQAAFASISISIPAPSVGGGGAGGSGVSATSAGGGTPAVAAVSVGSEYYASGAVLTHPTVFGFNPYTGNRMIGGEAGPEAVAPIATLQSYVGEAVAEQNAEQAAMIDRQISLMEMLVDALPTMMRDAMEGMAFKTNSREFGRLVKEAKA